MFYTPFTRAFVTVPARYGAVWLGFTSSCECRPNRTVLSWPTSSCHASTVCFGSVRFGCVVLVKTKTTSTSMLATSPSRFPQTVLVPARSKRGQLVPRRRLYLACAPRDTPTKTRLARFVRTSCEQGLARFISPGWLGSAQLSLELCSCEWGISF